MKQLIVAIKIQKGTTSTVQKELVWVVLRDAQHMIMVQNVPYHVLIKY